jgi:hypothetical protein
MPCNCNSLGNDGIDEPDSSKVIEEHDALKY